MKPVLIRLLLSALALGSALSSQPATQARQFSAEIVVVSSATLQPGVVASASLATIFGRRLATTTAVATDTDPNEPGVQLPLVLGGTTVRVSGQLAQLLFVSPNQINFRVPDPFVAGGNVGAIGPEPIEVLAGDGTQSAGTINRVLVMPGVFTADGSGRGLPAGLVLRIRANGQQSFEPLFTVQNGAVVPRPLDFGAANERVFLSLFTTGLRNAPDPNNDGNFNESVRVSMNGYEITPSFAGSAPGLPSIEQLNLEVPRTFLGLTKITLSIEVQGEQLVSSNQVIEVPLALPLLGTLDWRTSALAGKTVLSLASNETATLAGTEEGVFRTTLGTNNWRLASYGLPGVRRTTALLPESILGDPSMWLSATDGSGIYFSSNDGLLWTLASSAENTLLDNTKIFALSSNKDFIFVGTDDLGVVRARRFIQGSRWERTSTQFTPRVQALATNGSRVLAGTAAQGLYVSNDNGSTWTQNTGGIPTNAEVRALLHAGTAFFAGTATGLYRSTDNGASWTRLTDGVPATAAVNTLYAYGQTVLAGTASDGVLVSNDGVRWQSSSAGLAGQNVLALTHSGTRLLAGTAAGLYAAAITEPVNQPPLAESQELTLDEDTRLTITLRGSDPEGTALRFTIARGPEHGLLLGTGANLTYVPDPDYFGADQFEFRANDGQLGSQGAVVRLTVKPVNDPPQISISGERLLLTGQFANLLIQLSDPDQSDIPLTLTATGLPAGARLNQWLRTIDGLDYRRLFWVPATAGNYTITFTVADDSTPPLTAMQHVTLRVADNPEKGAWTSLNVPRRAQTEETLLDLFADGSELYAATIDVPRRLATNAQLWRSVDGGASWKPAGQGLSGLPQALVRQGNLLFIGTTTGLYRSPAPGPEGTPVWTPSNHGLPDARSIIGLAARENRLALITKDEVYLSTDQGNTWRRINGNLPLITPTFPPIFPLFNLFESVVFSGEALFVSIRPRGGLIFNQEESAPLPPTDVTEAAAEAAQAARYGVFRSTDDGITWQAVNQGLGIPPIPPGSSQGLLYGFNLTVSGTTLYASNLFGLFRSTNQGDRWQQVPTPLAIFLAGPAGAAEQADEGAASLSPTQIVSDGSVVDFPFAVWNGKLYAAPYGRGVYSSPESGSDWLPINLGLDEPLVLRLVLAGNRLYAVTSPLAQSRMDAPPNTRLFVRNLSGN